MLAVSCHRITKEAGRESIRGGTCAGQGIEADLLGGPYACTAADAAAAIGFDLGPVLTEGGRNVPHGCPASLAPMWEREQVAESPYQKFMQVRRPLLTCCKQRCGCLHNCGPSHLKLHSIACKESHRAIKKG